MKPELRAVLDELRQIIADETGVDPVDRPVDLPRLVVDGAPPAGAGPEQEDGDMTDPDTLGGAVACTPQTVVSARATPPVSIDPSPSGDNVDLCHTDPV